MKKILKSALLIMMGLVMFTSCEDDNDSNPIVKTPTEFVLNAPESAATNIDLANTPAVVFKCQQPNYGFPASAMYKVQISLNQDMSDFVELDQSFPTTTCSVDASLLASTLTSMAVKAGKTQDEFPMDIKVYVRMRANMITDTGAPVAGTEILSNVICLESVHLSYALPSVTLPEHIYVVGSFCGWDWGNSFEFIPVNENPDVSWRMVWIDEAGVKINTAKEWDGNEKGYSGITVAGDLAGKISANGDGNICSTTPQWYLMVVTASISGRDIKYTVEFNEPNVYLIGDTFGGWDELMAGSKFDVPTTMDADFVSPAFKADGEKRAYVKVPGKDWWRSEFIVLKGDIAYRGNGGDQDRVTGKAGQKLYLNFSTGKGSVK